MFCRITLCLGEINLIGQLFLVVSPSENEKSDKLRALSHVFPSIHFVEEKLTFSCFSLTLGILIQIFGLMLTKFSQNVTKSLSKTSISKA